MQPRADGTSQRVMELEAQLASMKEHMHSAIQKEIAENVKSAVDHALTSESARRRLTCQGEWYNKKRQRAERHHQQAQGATSSNSQLVRQIPPQPMCTNCGKGQCGSYCRRKMCRPCCVSTAKKEGKGAQQCEQHSDCVSTAKEEGKGAQSSQNRYQLFRPAARRITYL